MKVEAVGWTSLTSSGIAVSGPVLLWGVGVFAETANAQFSIFDGLDSSSGRLCFRGASESKIFNSITLKKPLRIDSGIYVELDANIDNCIVMWESRQI